MNSGTLFWILFICTLLTIFIHAEKKKKSKCKIPQSVELDDKWLESRGKIGWFSPMGSQLIPPVDENSDPIPPDNTTLKNKHCWSAQLRSTLGAIPFPVSCRYDDSNKQKCVMKTQGTPLHKYVRFFGDFTATFTDNENYIVAIGCLLGRINYWAALTTEKILDEETRESILDHIENIGFNRTELKSERDPVSIDKVKMIKCKKQKKKPIPTTVGPPGDKDTNPKLEKTKQ